MTYQIPFDEYAPAQVDDEALTERGVEVQAENRVGDGDARRSVAKSASPLGLDETLPRSVSACRCVRHGVDPYCERHTTNTWTRP